LLGVDTFLADVLQLQAQRLVVLTLLLCTVGKLAHDLWGPVLVVIFFDNGVIFLSTRFSSRLGYRFLSWSIILLFEILWLLCSVFASLF